MLVDNTVAMPWLRKNMNDMQQLNRLCLRYGTMQIITFLLRRLSTNLDLALKDARRDPFALHAIRAHLATITLYYTNELAKRM